MDIEKIIFAFKKKGYEVSLFANIDKASEYLNQKIDRKTVGFGDSDTLIKMNLFSSLSVHNTVFDPQNDINGIGFLEIAKKTLLTDIFITSANAVAETGEIVNIDGTGNRISGSLFGHEKVYFVIGVNKICPNLKTAISRAKNVSAPKNAKRLGLKTPCAKYGDKCYDCNSPDRICNGMLINLRKMDDIDTEIVIIYDDLGY